MTTVLDTALALHAAGCSVIPVRDDGTKAPAVEWRQYISSAPSLEQLHTWFGPDGRHRGLGVITGAVSGGLEMAEVEGRAAHRIPELADLAANSGLGELWQRITTGWYEVTPSGGIHMHYRVDGPVAGNTKLARRPATAAELEVEPRAKVQTLAETRGEGGFTVTAPTPGTHHPSGRPWVLVAGGPATIPLLTAEERDQVHVLLSMLDEMPAADEPAPRPVRSEADEFLMGGAGHDGDGAISPGDDYEARVDWTEILRPAGWTLVFTRGTTRYWRRPGKRIGISATTGHADDRDRLFVFTSSSEFDIETPYTKFGAYALLHHGGDHGKAATALVGEGYGHRPEQPRVVDELHVHSTAAIEAAFGSGLATPATLLTTTTATTYSETDDGNALRLVDVHGAQVRYCPQRGSWLRWTGHRWTWDEAGHVYELARAVARDLPVHDKEAKRHRKVSLSRRSIEAMVALAARDARVAVNLGALDARPYELNTPAGVIDLRTGELRQPDPLALHTRSTVAAPDFDAVPHQWLAFLADTFAGDPAITTYMQRLLGVSLVGTVLEQLLPFAFGSGANGKTTLLGAMQRIIGIGDDGYSISSPAEMLLASAQQGHPTEIARLSGARVVVTSELEDGQRFAEARIKQLTGRDVISGRFMRQDWFSFTPTHTLWLLANHQPAVRAGGPAFWRRLRLLPFLHTVPAEQRIADLEDRLVEQEGPAILAWMLAGARDYFAHGLQEPPAVLAATESYASDQDTVGRFVAECCTVGDPNAPHLRVPVANLRAAYEKWCRVEGDEPVSAKALTGALRSLGVLPERSRSARLYAGIRLNDVDDEPENLSPPQPPEPGEFSWGDGSGRP